MSRRHATDRAVADRPKEEAVGKLPCLACSFELAGQSSDHRQPTSALIWRSLGLAGSTSTTTQGQRNTAADARRNQFLSALFRAGKDAG